MVQTSGAMIAIVMMQQIAGVLSFRLSLQPLIVEQEKDLQELRMIDVDSEMSSLLFSSGVIREDVINKPGDKYTLKIETGKFNRNPFTHGLFKCGGAYGGLLAGGSVAGLGGMAAGGAAGMAAGDRAATTLDRILQGQASIGISDDWKQKHSGVKLQRRNAGMQQFTSSLAMPPPTQSLQPQTSFMSSIRSIFRMGNKNTNKIDSIIANTTQLSPALSSISTAGPSAGGADTKVGAKPSLFEVLFPSYLAMEDTEKKVFDGLNAGLKSKNPVEVEDSQITIAMLEVLRRENDGVKVCVEPDMATATQVCK
jgi:hypothetical protein